MNAPIQRFGVGQKFIQNRGRVRDIRTVVDVLRTYNLAGDLVSIRYVAEHDFCGQKVVDRDVVDTTIARGLTQRGTRASRSADMNARTESNLQLAAWLAFFAVAFVAGVLR